MRNHYLALFSLLLTLSFASCVKDSLRQTYTFYRPVYKTAAQVRQSIKSDAPQAVRYPGKIFYKDGYAFLNELDKGVHIIDVRNATQPKVVAFVAIPGCIDLAVRGDILYADMFTDLVAINIADPLSVKVTSIVDGVFPHRSYGSFYADTSKIVVDWVRVDTTVYSIENSFLWGAKAEDVLLFQSFSTNSVASGGQVSNGTGGSMARFTLANDRMYAVSYSDLKVFNTSVPEKPAYVKLVDIPEWNVETIYPFGNNLFIGSSNGMFIYSITDKDNPVKLSKFDHARVCDPVISDGKYAYVTLRNGTQCQGFLNELDVVNATNLMQPSMVKVYPLTNPHGLGKDGNLLLICDGKDGVRVMDATKADDIRQLGQVKGMTAFDVIAVNGIAIVSATDGLYLINYQQPSSPFVSASLKIAQ